jgi:ribosomal protein L24E
MSLEDTIGSQDEVPSCVVCGKNVTKGGGFARINHKGTMVNLCCPHCMGG